MDIQDIKNKIAILEYKLNKLGYTFIIIKNFRHECFLLRIINYATGAGLEEMIDTYNFNDFKIYRFLSDFYNNYNKIKKSCLQNKSFK